MCTHRTGAFGLRIVPGTGYASAVDDREDNDNGNDATSAESSVDNHIPGTNDPSIADTVSRTTYGRKARGGNNGTVSVKTT